MARTSRGWSCLCVMLLALAAGACNRIEARLRPRPAGPNVLLVTIDTLRADRVGAYGAKLAETPVLDALAARGALFEQATATVPLTLPSHTSIHTGLYPPHHGVRHNGIFRAGDELETLAERFHAGGWRTGAVIAADVLSPEFGLAQGFDRYDADLPVEKASPNGFFERTADRVTDAALAWLAEDDAPFFLWVHYYDPHEGHHPPEPWAARFADHPYEGEIAFTDHEVGRLLAGLERRGELANTVVAVTADHGEGLGEHGEPTHTYLVYESVTQVPLIFAGPGVPRGARVASVVSNAGVAATLLALAGAPPLPHADVADLAPYWKARVAGSFAYAESIAGQLDYGWSPLHVVRTDARHYIKAPRPELFDTREPAQLHNLLELPTPEALADQREAEARLDQILASAKPLATQEVDAELRARIEALGYVVRTGEVAQNGADPKDVHHLATLMFDSWARMTAGEDQEALALAERALRDLPESPEVHHTLALAYAKVGSAERALPHAEKAARSRWSTPSYVSQLAFLQVSLGRLDAARDTYARLEGIGADDPDAQIVLMGTARLGRAPDEVERFARRALELARDRRWIHERVGEAWEGLGEYERAYAVYTEALERFPDEPRLHMRLAIQEARFGNEEASAAHLERAGDARYDVELRNRLGIVYGARGDLARAEKLFRESLAAEPARVVTRRNLAKVLRDSGRAAEAQALLAGLPEGVATPAVMPARAAE